MGWGATAFALESHRSGDERNAAFADAPYAGLCSVSGNRAALRDAELNLNAVEKPSPLSPSPLLLILIVALLTLSRDVISVC